MGSATGGGLNGLYGRENWYEYILSRLDRDDRLPKIPNDSFHTRTLISEAFQKLPILYQAIMALKPNVANRYV
jgi:hypothetical protein